jgi:phage repressor protein C with HTH and peptisase S24 domain
MNIKEEFSQRFWEAIEANGLQHKSQKEIGAFLGVSAPMVSNYKNALKMPASETAVMISIKLSVSYNWLMTGINDDRHDSNSILKSKDDLSTLTRNNKFNGELHGSISPWDSNTELDSDEVEVPFFMDVELAAGVGLDSSIEISGPKLRFSKSTLRKANVEVENAAVVKIAGNSMEPRLYDGDVVGIDFGKKIVVDGNTYAINHDGMLRVKRLYRLPGGALRVNSLNSEEHPDEVYDAEQKARIVILGKVFFSSSMW